MATDDYVGFTFFVGCMAMMAASAFLPIDELFRQQMENLHFGIRFDYFYRCSTLLVHERLLGNNATSPTFFRYVDWVLTVPLMCVEFYLILKAAGATKSLMWKLIFLSVIMLVTGYFGEAVHTTGNGPALWGLISGLAYFAIVYEIWKGGAAKLAEAAGGAVLSAHKTLLKFVFIGWAIYPIGYMAGTEGWYSGIFGGLPMDVIYNVGDAINKIGFGLVVYNLAVSSK